MANEKETELLEFYRKLDISNNHLAILDVISEKTTDEEKLDKLLNALEGDEND